MRHLEYLEQVKLVEWCRLKRWPCWCSDQAVRIIGLNRMAALARRTRMGVRSGLPDLVVFVRCGKLWTLAFVEMKQPLGPKGGKNGSDTTPGQEEFRKLCEAAGISHGVCHGFEEAKKFLEGIESYD